MYIVFVFVELFFLGSSPPSPASFAGKKVRPGDR